MRHDEDGSGGARVAALLGLAAAAGATDDELAATLRGVVQDDLRACDAEDADGAMRPVHGRSPQYGSDEFAGARVEVRGEGPSGSVFVNNTTDDIVLFHQECGIWKPWTNAVLGVEFEQPIGVVVPPRVGVSTVLPCAARSPAC